MTNKIKQTEKERLTELLNDVDNLTVNIYIKKDATSFINMFESAKPIKSNPFFYISDDKVAKRVKEYIDETNSITRIKEFLHNKED